MKIQFRNGIFVMTLVLSPLFMNGYLTDSEKDLIHDRLNDLPKSIERFSVLSRDFHDVVRQYDSLRDDKFIAGFNYLSPEAKMQMQCIIKARALAALESYGRSETEKAQIAKDAQEMTKKCIETSQDLLNSWLALEVFGQKISSTKIGTSILTKIAVKDFESNQL